MHVYDEYSNVEHLQLVREIALGPESQIHTMNKYCVNGFKFQTEQVSRFKKTNNSGVYIQGDADGSGQTIDYFGVIHEIIEVRYSGWPKERSYCFGVSGLTHHIEAQGWTNNITLLKLSTPDNTEVMILLSLHKMQSKSITLHIRCVETRLIGGL
jgi:hypothetical protein